MSATFDQWVQAAFDHGPAGKGEREWYWGENFEVFWDFLELTDELKVRYLARLFRNPEPIKVYSLDQVAQAIWFLIGESSPGRPTYLLSESEAPLELRVEAIRAMGDFFAKFVAPAAPGPARESEDEFHLACYMWWDIFSARPWDGPGIRPDWMETFADNIRKMNSQLPPDIEGFDESGLEEFQQMLLSLPAEIKEEASRFRLPVVEAEIHQACLETMREVLSLPSELCQLSALHGLNHWQKLYAPRVEEIIDAYLTNSKTATPRMREYATGARSGFRP